MWARDGESLFYMRYGGLGAGRELWSIRRDGSGEEKVTDLAPLEPAGQFYDIGSQGDAVYIQFDEGRDEIWLAELAPTPSAAGLVP